MYRVKVLKMNNTDVDEVFRLEELVHPNHHWSKESFYNELSNNLAYYYCVKNEKNTILAYIGFWLIIDEAHITTLAVHPDFRRNQLAQILLIKMIDICYKNMVKYITLEVRESNLPAILLYEKFLFESIGMRKNYYQDNGENAIIMFTQNIWYDKFKKNFISIKEGISGILVSYDE